MNNHLKIDISTRSVVKIILTLFCFYLLYLVRDALLLLFIVGILVSALRPVINSWGSKIGKPLSITLIVLIILIGIAGFVYVIIPPFVNETRQLAQNFPQYLENIKAINNHFPSLAKNLSSLTQSFGSVTASFLSITFSFLGGVVAFLTVIVLTIYILVDERIFSRGIIRILPKEKRDDITAIVQKISQMIGGWLRGQLLLAIVIGVCVFLGLTIIGVPYALTLAVIAGLLEIIPLVGPVVSGALASLVALTTMPPIFVVIVIAFFIVLQQLENNLLVPKIMQKAVGLPPAIIIIAILVGGKILGVLGALLAVPVSGILYVLFQEWESVKRIFDQE